MGMFDKLFGGKDYPPLPANDEAQTKLQIVKGPLEDLARRVTDKMEVVPADQEAFVFLGKPPKHFGLAWIHDGKVSGLKELAEQNQLSQSQVGKLVEELGKAYEHASSAPRFSAEVGGKKAVVIPSSGLESEVRQILQRAA